MAKNNSEVIQTLFATARHLETSNHYQWGHMGSCNCGFLAQQITKLTRAEIHRRAMLKYGNWNEQLNDYCPASGLPFDELISELIEHGFSTEDLKHLEKLSDPEILRCLPCGKHLTHNCKDDVVLYLKTWAWLLETKLIQKIKLPDLLAPVIEQV